MKFPKVDRKIYIFIIFILTIYLSTIVYKFYEDFTNPLPESYFYIYSSVFNKSLAFDTIGQKSFVYVDPVVPEECDFETQKNQEKPQKWIIDSIDETRKIITISSFNKDGVKYYLTANADGSVEATLFGGGTNQNWIIDEYTNANVNSNKNANKDPNQIEKFYVKSLLYGTYLTSTNMGYVKEKAGNVFLTPSNQSKEVLWSVLTCDIDITMRDNEE